MDGKFIINIYFKIDKTNHNSQSLEMFRKAKGFIFND
jgi:hypothetical protein